MNKKSTLTLLAIFSIAMALLESAVVVYMRRLYYPDNPLELFPLQFLNAYDPRLELSREVATIVMILSVAFLAERSNLTRSFAAFVFVFGMWDLFYYIWLKVLMDWPQSWLEWDVLFLIPMVWLGPWICPALIATMFIVWGGWILQSSAHMSWERMGAAIFVLGAILGLIAFMQPAAAVMWVANGDAVIELSRYTPGRFWWWLFAISFLLMAVGLGQVKRLGSQVVDEATSP